jgi:hypothetical protein
MEKRNTNNSDKLNSSIRRRGGQILLRQELWKIITEHNDKKLINGLKAIYSRYPLRISDIFIVLGIFGFYGIILTFWKNYLNDVYRTTYPYKLYLSYWAFFPYVYQRQPKEPIYAVPPESDARDFELCQSYKENKENLLFNKRQQWEVNLRSELENIVPSLDHREVDSTEFQTLIKMNYDISSLNLFKKSINKECVDRGIYKDDKLYLKEKITSDYKVSDYVYKDDLYKELLELIKI